MLIRALADEGVEFVFGYPGGAVLHIYDAIFQQDKVKHILVRHEQAAGHAADGYARVTGKTGVVLATSGPGATNTVTAIATAYMDSIPMVVLSGQVPSHLIGEDAFQETDMVGVSRPIVKHSFQVRKAEDIPAMVKKAFYIAASGRPGPVVIDFPKNIQQIRTQPVWPTLDEVKRNLRGYNPEVYADEPHRFSQEPYRRKLFLMRARLLRNLDRLNAAIDGHEAPVAAGYASERDFLEDLYAIRDSLHSHGDGNLADAELKDLIRLAESFGFYLAQLDVRQESTRHTDAVTELFARAPNLPDYAALSEDERMQVLRSGQVIGYVGSLPASSGGGNVAVFFCTNGNRLDIVTTATSWDHSCGSSGGGSTGGGNTGGGSTGGGNTGGGSTGGGNSRGYYTWTGSANGEVVLDSTDERFRFYSDTGCIYSAGAFELDDREGPLRDLLHGEVTRWRAALRRTVQQAVEMGHLMADTDPQQLVSEISALALGLIHDVRFLRDSHAADRAQASWSRLRKTYQP